MRGRIRFQVAGAIGLVGAWLGLAAARAADGPPMGRTEEAASLSIAPISRANTGRPPSVADLPPPLPVPAPSPAALSSAALSSPPAASGMPLVPGQVIRPIDLACALRLAGARDLEIAIARERVAQAVADLSSARATWLPSLFLGPNWIRHDGQAQIVQGQVQTISKSSLFLGATAALGQGVTGPVPAGGPAPLSSTTAIIRISDAIFLPLVARQVVAANRAGIAVATNDALLGVSQAYFDLQAAAGRLQIAREAEAHATILAELTASYARTGAGLEADHRRSLTELDRQRRNVEMAVGDLEATSAELVRRTRLDPRIVVAPIEPPETVLHLVTDDCPIDSLIFVGLRNRPELAQNRELVDATILRLKQAKLRPLIPSLALRYSAGGFGGGPNAFFGNFNGRGDVDANLFWSLENLGFGDRARIQRSAAEHREAVLRLMQVQDLVASQVVQAEKYRIAAGRQMQEASRAVPEAIRSLQLNFTNIRRGAGLPGATRPIEVLQPIQALAQARSDYLDAVILYNRAQFRLFHAIGRPPLIPPDPAADRPMAHPG